MNATTSPAREFVSEEIQPVASSFDVGGMSRAEPGLPARFTWREEEWAVVDVLERWKESGVCKTHFQDIYLRKHWFRVRAHNGHDLRTMTIYFDRQARRGISAKKRWWLYSIA